ncbi:MAG: WD40 repeat domain-containing protein [Planctomycetota bacterium]
MSNRFRFSLRAALLGLTLMCVAVWWFIGRPRELQQRQVVSGRQKIHDRDRVWLAACFDPTVREHLVTVLGDSRLSHWGRVSWLFSPDAKTIISYGDDQALIVWNRDDGSIRQGFFDVPFAARAADAGKIFMGDSKGNVRVWTVANESFSDVQWQVPVSMNSACGASPDAAYFVYGSRGGSLAVWDAVTGRERQSIDPNPNAAEVSLEEKWEQLVVTSKHTLVLASPKFVTEFDLLSGELLGSIEVPTTDDGGRASIFDMKLVDDGKKMLVADAVGRVLAFDWENRQFSEIVFESRGSIRSIALSPDGNTLRVAKSSGVLDVNLWHGRQVDTQTIYLGRASAVGEPPRSLIGTSSGRIVVIDGDREARLIGGPRGDAICFAYSHHGDQLALAGRDGRIVIRETATWSQTNAWLAHHGAVSYLEWTPDGERLASFGEDRVVAIWNPETGTEEAVLKAFTFSPQHPTLDRTGRWLAVQDLTRESFVSIYDVASWAEQDRLDKEALHPRGQILFSADGTKLFVGANFTTVQVWDRATEKIVGTMGGRTIADVKLALSPDGKVIYAMHSRTVEAFDTTTLASLWIGKLTSRRTYSLASHPASPLLAIGGDDGAVVLLDALTGTVLKRLTMGPTRGEIQQVGFSPDGRLLTAAMSNGAVVVMHVPRLQ